MNKAFWMCSTIFLSFLTGCQVVSVKNQAINVSISNDRDSILTRNKLSEASLNVLSMTGRESKNCMDQPEQCVDELQKIPQIVDEQFLSTASELFLAKSLALSKSSECKTGFLDKTQSSEKQQLQKQNIEKCLDTQLAMLDQSIRYSYAYLFKTQRAPQDRIFDNRQVQIRDFYNLAISHLVQTYNLRHDSKEANRKLQIGSSTYHVDFEFYPQLKDKKAEQLLSTYNMNFSGLRSITRRDGFGSEFLVVLPEDKTQPNVKSKYIVNPLHYEYPNGVNPNIHDARYLAATITAQPKSQRDIKDILTNPEFHLKLYDPYANEKVNVAGKDYPLAANFSAPYGLWLAENNLGRAAYLSLIDRDDQVLMPQLYMLEPYNPNKKVIVLVHGLASSPEAWIRLTNDIMGDPILRENFQVWQVFYSTNMPILESRFQIYSLVTQAFDLVEPNTAAAKDAVLIGHSMGGIISRLFVSSADLTSKTEKFIDNRQLEQFKNNPLFNERFKIQAIPNFDRAIFLASPHRGTDYADRWFTRAARKIIKLPGAFLGVFADALQGQTGTNYSNKELDHTIIQNGPSDLAKNSNFTLLTKDIVPTQGFKFHSIIGNITDSNDINIITDGVVPYKSAHLDGAISEKILKGGHSIQETPEAVLELRRILRLHLTQLRVHKP